MNAGVAELADAYGSGPYGGNPMKVQVLSPAPRTRQPPFRAAFSLLEGNGYEQERAGRCGYAE